MKKNIVAKFTTSLIKSLGIIFLMFVTGYVSYAATNYYYNISDKEPNANSMFSNLFSNYSVEERCINVCYKTNSKGNKIEGAVIEIFNTKTYNLDYVTIPANGELTISSAMYHNMFEKNIDIPQIIKLSEMKDYFKGDDMFSISNLLIEDAFGIKVSCYTVIGKGFYKTMFETSEKGLQIYTEEFKNKLKSIQGDSKELKSLIKEIYKKIDSSLLLNDKLKYGDYYSKVNFDNIYFHKVYGEGNEEDYVIDVEKTKEMFEKILSNESYKTIQEDEDNISELISSIDKVIQIYNGANITGLAKKYQDKLIEEGYNVTNIYNYESGTLSNTKIIVKEDGIGLDLLKYFNNASVEVGELSVGIDIIIILGTNDGW